MPGRDTHNSPMRYRIAYGSVPKDGGTFTFYRNLRPALLRHGIELVCVTVGRQEAALIERSYQDDGCVLLAANSSNIRTQAQAFTRWCEQESIDIVIAVNSVAILSALPHLPGHVRIVARCANAFDEGYRVTLAGGERLARIVALTPRLRDDLVNRFEVPPGKIRMIPNGIDPVPYDAIRNRDVQTSTDGEVTGKPLQLGFLGRLEHTQKGVLHLPAILQELKTSGVGFRLRIAGKGKHERELRRRLAPFIAAGEVEFIGALPASEVPAFLTSLDVLLFTSHFEGCPNTLLEAMMAGTAIVAFQIDGIVDYLLDAGHTGLVAPAGDCNAFARSIGQLARDPGLRLALGLAAAREARERFTPAVAASQYSEVFEDVMAKPVPPTPPRPWSGFAINPEYDPGWKAIVPAPVRSLARRLRARLAD
jgi:glycosyltransferase involved in cell wall biosynthesis